MVVNFFGGEGGGGGCGVLTYSLVPMVLLYGELLDRVDHICLLTFTMRLVMEHR